MIKSLSFNQDNTLLATGTEEGFKIVDAVTGKVRFSRNIGSFSLVESFYRTNIVLLVGGGKYPYDSPKKLLIWDDLKEQVIQKVEFPSNIRNIKANRDLIFVSLEYQVYGYMFENMTSTCLLKTISNPTGALDLCPTENIMVTLSQQSGQIVVFNSTNDQRHLIMAHEHAIQLLTLSYDGKYVMTSSDMGTIIRVFDTGTGKKLREFRRGVNPSSVLSMAISFDNQYIAILSDNGTLHLYHFLSGKNNQLSSWSYLSSYFSSERSFVRIPINIRDNIQYTIGFNYDTSCLVMIADTSGYCIGFTFDDNGEFKKELEYRFFE